MLNDRLAGNAPLKAAVAEMRRTGRMGHSLLLVGEPGLGAGFAARCIAADLLFPAGGPAAEALLRGECCQAVAEAGEREGRIVTGVVREAVCAASGGLTDTIKVGQIRALRTEIYHSGLATPRRAVLIPRAEKLQTEAANALLKVLEDPPENVTFLLTAASLAGVLPTIRSRCSSLALAPVPAAECAACCTARGVEPGLAALLAQVYDGRIGTALAVAGDEKRRAMLETASFLAAAAAAHDAYRAAVLLSAFEKDRRSALLLLDDLSALAACALRGAPVTPLTPHAAVHVIRVADAARARFAANGNARLVLTATALQLAKA